MIKSLLASSVATLLLAGTAIAAAPSAPTSLRIESEDQFVRDYGDLVERAAPGVYQIVKGPLAGKTIAMGEAGLAYDLAGLRARTPNSLRERLLIKKRIKRLEHAGARFATLRELQSRGGAKLASYGTLPCWYHNWSNGTQTYYYAVAFVNATAEYYLDNGGGGLNYYYARASASASGHVATPPNVPYWSGVISTSALAWNHHTGALVQRYGYGSATAVSTGYVYSGPDFSHDLGASATVEGEGDCFGYVSISDALN